MNVASKPPIETLSFVQVTPPALRDRTPDNTAMQAFEASVGSQIVSQILDAIAIGKLAPGTPLPSHADLAEVWQLNRNTIVDAFTRLRVAGATEGDRSRTFVTSNPDRVRALVARSRISEAVRFAVSLGRTKREVDAICKEIIHAYFEERRKKPDRRAAPEPEMPASLERRRRGGGAARRG
jgi:DNA-binding transcriptional regulator YhcF (GntR family)